MSPDAKAIAESVFREEYGRTIATLIRISGSFDRAEAIEAYTRALSLTTNSVEQRYLRRRMQHL
jgi:predicted RNA polymerase sigma factor